MEECGLEHSGHTVGSSVHHSQHLPSLPGVVPPQPQLMKMIEQVQFEVLDCVLLHLDPEDVLGADDDASQSTGSSLKKSDSRKYQEFLPRKDSILKSQDVHNLLLKDWNINIGNSETDQEQDAEDDVDLKLQVVSWPEIGRQKLDFADDVLPWCPLYFNFGFTITIIGLLVFTISIGIHSSSL